MPGQLPPLGPIDVELHAHAVLRKERTHVVPREDLLVHHAAGRTPRSVEIDEEQPAGAPRLRARLRHREFLEAHLRRSGRGASRQKQEKQHLFHHRIVFSSCRCKNSARHGFSASPPPVPAQPRRSMRTAQSRPHRTNGAPQGVSDSPESRGPQFRERVPPGCGPKTTAEKRNAG